MPSKKTQKPGTKAINLENFIERLQDFRKNFLRWQFQKKKKKENRTAKRVRRLALEP